MLSFRYYIPAPGNWRVEVMVGLGHIPCGYQKIFITPKIQDALEEDETAVTKPSNLFGTD
jgi:hypothetical protein